MCNYFKVNKCRGQFEYCIQVHLSHRHTGPTESTKIPMLHAFHVMFHTAITQYFILYHAHRLIIYKKLIFKRPKFS